MAIFTAFGARRAELKDWVVLIGVRREVVANHHKIVLIARRGNPKSVLVWMDILIIGLVLKAYKAAPQPINSRVGQIIWVKFFIRLYRTFALYSS